MIEEMAPLTVLAVGPKGQAAAIAILRKFSGQALTMTDAVGLHILRLRRLKHCWSTDFHRGLTGVPLVIRSS